MSARDRRRAERRDRDEEEYTDDDPDGPGGGVDLGGVAGDADPSDAPGAGDSGGGTPDVPSGVEPGSRPSGGSSGGGASGGGGGGSSGSSNDPVPGPGPTTPGGTGSDVGGGTTGDSTDPGGPGGGVDLGGVSGSQGPSDAPGAGSETGATGGMPGPGPTTRGGLGGDTAGGGGAGFPVADAIAGADPNEEIVDRATTGGFLSERGENAGLLPPTAAANTPRGQLEADTSETRVREFARGAGRFGEQLDVGAAFSSPADPLGSGGSVDDGRPIGSGDPAGENPAENLLEGGGQLLAGALPAAAVQTETAAETGQALVVDDLFADFGAGEVGETATAVGRDRAASTAARAQANPAEFAGGVAAGAALGAGVLGRGRTGTLRDAARAELDPRIGPFGETFESRTLSRFLSDDRGQAQLVGRSRQRDPRGSGGEDTGPATDDDLGPDIGPFDRSDSRLFDPSREFDDDVGGMQDPRDPVDPTAAESRQDIGGGVSGRGDPETAPGVDAESFSDRGFGDFEGFDQRFDRRADDTLDPDTDATAPFVDPDAIAGSGVGAAAGVFGADLDGRADADADAGLFGRQDTPPGIDTDTGVDVFGRQDTPPLFDPGQDTPTDLFDRPRDPTTRDPTTRDPTTRDPERDRPRDPEPIRTDPPDIDLPIDLDTDGTADSGAGAFGLSSEAFDTGVAQDLDEFFRRL